MYEVAEMNLIMINILIFYYYFPQEEKLEHVKTKAKLASESERLQFALGEIDILNKQLQREKLSFENAYVCLNTL